MNSNSRIPSVSIGLPVYNGGELLKTALDTLLSQEFTDFELIISDNASTDTTERFCREYAARDARIVYLRRDRNYGMGDNGRKVLSLSRGKYFMAASHDDLWHPRFLSACVERLDANPAAVLATTDIDFFKPDETPASVICPPLHTAGMGLRDRVAALFHEVNAGYHAYGVYRRESLRDIDLNFSCFASDLVILLQLMFLGEVEYIPQKLLRYRFVRRTDQEHLDAVSATPGECRSTRLYTVLTINLLRVILNARIAPSLKRILLSDVIEIIAVKNPEWRDHILIENAGLIPFVNPEKDGVLPMLEVNLVGVFAALLLPYCRRGDPYEPTIDFSDIEGFREISLEDRSKPVPGYKEFIDRCIYLVEHGEYDQAIAYYEKYGRFQPDFEAVRKAGAVIEKLRSGRTAASITAPVTSPVPERMRIAFQFRPPAEGRTNWDTVIQQRLLDRLVALGHDVMFVGQTDTHLQECDIVHFFTMIAPGGLETVLGAAIESHIPFVITALQDAPPLSAAKAERWFRIFEKYVAQGQSSDVFDILRNEAGDFSISQPSSALSILAARNAGRVLACGPTEARLLGATIPFANIDIAPFGVDAVPPGVSGELFERAFGMKDFVLCPGPLDPQGNQLMLLKALENEEIPVVLLDGGPADRPDYAGLCRKMRRKGTTIHTGSISDELLASAYRASRCFCLPSWYDLPGLMTLEAASFGCAVVASRQGCIGDYLGEMCEYCEPDSFESIRNAVLKAYREGPAAGLRERAAGYTWEAAARRIEAVYREVLQEKQTAK